MDLNRGTVTQKLNTKGCCFLCLESDVNHEKEISDNEDSYSISIRCLLQHLQIPLDDNKEDVNVDLCKSCEKTLKGFTTVVEELQKAQMKVNFFLEQINKSISGSKDTKRVQVYSKRMTGDPVTLTQLAVVDNLRNKLTVKCLKSRVGPIPCMKLKRTEFQKQIGPEIKQEADEEEDAIGEEVEDSFAFEGCHNDAETIDTLVSTGLSLSPKSAAQEIKFHPAPVTSSALESQPTRKVQGRKSKTVFKNVYYTKDAQTGIYHCKECDKTCRTSANIIEHYRRIHLQKRYPCDICQISEYGDFQRLQNHKKICQETIEERLAKEKERENSKFVCNSCGKKFRTPAVLKNHQKVHSNNTPRYPCNFCGKIFTQMSNLTRHKDAVHLGKVYFCQFCNKKIVFKECLRVHEKNCKHKIKIEPGLTKNLE